MCGAGERRERTNLVPFLLPLCTFEPTHVLWSSGVFPHLLLVLEAQMRPTLLASSDSIAVLPALVVSHCCGSMACVGTWNSALVRDVRTCSAGDVLEFRHLHAVWAVGRGAYSVHLFSIGSGGRPDLFEGSLPVQRIGVLRKIGTVESSCRFQGRGRELHPDEALQPFEDGDVLCR